MLGNCENFLKHFKIWKITKNIKLNVDFSWFGNNLDCCKIICTGYKRLQTFFSDSWNNFKFNDFLVWKIIDKRKLKNVEKKKLKWFPTISEIECERFIATLFNFER